MPPLSGSHRIVVVIDRPEPELWAQRSSANPSRPTMNAAFKELAELCQDGDDLTWPLLRQKLDAGPDDLVRGDLSDDVEDDTTLLHYACYNPRVTLDVVRNLVALYPEAVEVRTDYGWLPLHRACNNAACPDDVVEYLADLHPAALGVSWPHAGLPLHCLLTRLKGDEEEVGRRLNLDLARTLVEAHPDALTNQDNRANRTPLLCAVEREDLSMDMVRLLVDPDRSVLRQAGGYGEGGDIPLVALLKTDRRDEWRVPFDVVQFVIRSAPDAITPSALNDICESRHVTLETVKLIIESRPDISLLDQADGMLPLHSLCLNHSKKDQDSWLLPIIEYVVNVCPQSVRVRNDFGFLPLFYATDTTLEITKFLVEKYPESVTAMARQGTAFHSACRNGGIDTVAYLFEQNPEAINSAAHPALHIPLGFNRDVEAKVQFLLERDPQSTKAKDPSTGDLPLHTACSEFSWDLSMIKRLFNLYPDAIATRNHEGRYPLHEFLAFDRRIRESKEYPDPRGKAALETVIFLVTQFPSSVRVADQEGMLPLHHASKCYNTGIVLYLAQAYPDSVKVESPKFGLPLHCAAQQGKSGLQIVRYLSCQYPEAHGTSNETVGLPLECTKNKEIFVYLLLLRYSRTKKNYVHRALEDNAVLNPLSIVQVFVHHFRGELVQTDNFGRHPLHVAVSSSRASHDVVRALLTVHPDAALHQDKQGCIPLHLFFRHSASLEVRACEEIFDELTSNRIDSAKVLDRNGCLPLHYACRYGTAKTTMGTLIKNYSEAVRIRDRNGCIPLHMACRRGMLSVDAIELLMGFDYIMIQAADRDLELPLHKACRGGHLEIINYLLDQFAPATGMRNISGYLPIHILCRKSGKVDISIMDTPKFTETVFRLLRAYPEAVL
ncbi:hypothetical protein ACHAWF_009027 [Thalassiosira exigua]